MENKGTTATLLTHQTFIIPNQKIEWKATNGLENDLFMKRDATNKTKRIKGEFIHIGQVIPNVVNSIIKKAKMQKNERQIYEQERNSYITI